MNTVALTGVLQRFEEMKAQNGNAWVKLTIRVSNNMKNKEGKYDSSFFDARLFGKTAELFLRFHSQRTGKQIGITGNLVQETWEKDGQKRSNVVIMVQNCDLPPYDEKETAPQNAPKPASSNAFDPFAGTPADNDINSSDLPF